MTVVIEILLPSRLTRDWALKEGAHLPDRAAKEDLVLVGQAVVEVDLLAAGTLHHARRQALAHGKRLALRAPSEILKSRLDAHDPGPLAHTEAIPVPEPLLERAGRSVWKKGNDIAKAGWFAVEMARGLWAVLTGRERTWPGATWRQLHELGTTALPVVLLLTGLIGLTLALLMGQQLASYGASIHLATLMGVAFVREVGPLLTAVILAGRSGSAITAELASMKVQEEVDALQTLGAKEAAFLVAPRLLALVLSMPFLALFASLCGILAGLLIATMQLGLSSGVYFQVLSEAVTLEDIGFTILKSVVFAFVIVFLACRIGLSTHGGSDAVGRSTTRTVVAGIFWTVIVDCIFALVLYL